MLSCLLAGCAILRPAQPPPTESDAAFYQTYSKKFGIRFTGTENKRLILAIDRWLGAPYRMGGCSPAGVDCSCFVQAIYKEVYNISLPRTAHDMYRACIKITPRNLREADLVFLKDTGKKISHVGIYLKDNRFAHVSTARGVMISSLTEPAYRKSLHAAGRVPPGEKPA